MVWRRTRSEEDLAEYRGMKRAFKMMVQETRRGVDEEWTLSIAIILKRIRKNFGRG